MWRHLLDIRETKRCETLKVRKEKLTQRPLTVSEGNNNIRRILKNIDTTSLSRILKSIYHIEATQGLTKF